MNTIAPFACLAFLTLGTACRGNDAVGEVASSPVPSESTAAPTAATSTTSTPPIVTLSATTTASIELSSTTTVDRKLLALAAADAFVAAVQSRDLPAVQAIASKRCISELNETILEILASVFNGRAVVTSITNITEDSADVELKVEGSPFKPGHTTVRLIDGVWRWDGCD